MKEAGVAGLIERFADLPDPRVEGGTDHDLLDIVVLALCAVMSGAEGWDDIERAVGLGKYFLGTHHGFFSSIPATCVPPPCALRLSRLSKIQFSATLETAVSRFITLMPSRIGYAAATGASTIFLASSKSAAAR